MRINRAISIRQPYAEQILIGLKTREFRSRHTRIQGERVYIYASLRPVLDRREWSKVGCMPGDLPSGRIVGSVVILGCRKVSAGGYAYLLGDPVRLRRPLLPRNQPQPVFWRPQF